VADTRVPTASAVRLLLFLTLLLLAAPLAVAQPGPQGLVGRVDRHVDVIHYDVEGTTVAELAEALQARGPSLGGRRFFGLTQWTLNAEYTWAEGDTGCSVERLVVRVATTITLPRWQPPRGAPPELVQAWARFSRALETHEREHQRLAEEAAEAIRWELATFRLPSCANAEARARQVVATIVEDYNRRNEAYDQRTRHGVDEGAGWPPRPRVGADVGQR
jgi:predicted secreted Zn-dependent protease